MSDDNSGIVYLTKEKLKELEEELRDLKSNGRADVIQKIQEARGHGDLSENAEYDAAREAQAHLELRISKLQTSLSRARVMEAGDLPDDKVYVLSHVKIKDQRTKEVIEYMLVSPEEANFEENKISVTSPIGKGLLGKAEGDVVSITVPAGTLSYKIISISR